MSEYLIKVFISFTLLTSHGVQAQTDPGLPLIHANEKRIETRIKELSMIGDTSSGLLKRVAYSNGDIEARKYIVSLMRSVGLSVMLDQAGNIIGKRKGENPDLPPISFGSHTDAVPNGGIYDGNLGVIGAIECIELLNENHLVTNHPLEVIDFVDEEGGLIGSQAMIGELPSERLNAVTNSGKTIRQGIRDIGGDPDHLDKAIRRRGDLQAFLELHIEQGATLEKASRDIGVVDGIVGINDWNIVITGKTNHAGTTPMPLRVDALVIAAKLILMINETVLNIPGRQVATVGQIKAFPGATNVIPGKVVMSLDLRDLSGQKSDSVFAIIQWKADSLAAAKGASIQFIPDHVTTPAVTDKRIQNMIVLSAKELGLSSMYLPSGASHDTQDMARIAPVGMIFVPSKNGISHSPEEYTSPKDMADGVSVLLRTISKIDKTPW
jgi:N-carbamoyl-L-amino-acid hydrolase